MNHLEKVVVKLCEAMPLGIAPLEKDGFCQKPVLAADNCKYCHPITYPNNPYNYLCAKRTYTPIVQTEHPI